MYNCLIMVTKHTVKKSWQCRSVWNRSDWLLIDSPSYITVKLNFSMYSFFFRGGSRISGKKVHTYKGVWVRFADFISFFLNIPWKWNNLVSLRQNYFIFIGYFTENGGGGEREFKRNPKPLWIRHCLCKCIKICAIRHMFGSRPAILSVIYIGIRTKMSRIYY